MTTSKPPAANTSGKAVRQSSASRVDRRVGHHAVADADVVVEAGQHLAGLGRLDPQAEPADVDGLLVQVHAVQVVLQDLPVHVEQLRAAQLVSRPLRLLVDGVQLLERLDQERAAAARRIDDAQRRQVVLPAPPRN